MGDFVDDMRAMYTLNALERAARRLDAPYVLDENGIQFTIHNNGAHIICYSHDGVRVDFWPGTGKWKVTNQPMSGHGIDSLLTFLKSGIK